MAIIKKIRTGKGYILAVELKLLEKTLIVLRGSRGYIMCGYLDLKTAEKFKDCAAVITGVSTIQDSLKSRIYSCTRQAKKLGIYKGQAVRDALKIIT